MLCIFLLQIPALCRISSGACGAIYLQIFYQCTQRKKKRKRAERNRILVFPSPFLVHTCLKNKWSATTHRQINIFSCLQDMSVTFVRRCTYLLLDRNINFNSSSKILTTIHLSHVSQWTVTLVRMSVCLVCIFKMIKRFKKFKFIEQGHTFK